MATTEVVAIPAEVSSIIPKFDGDERLLNLYIKKCEYVIKCYKRENNPAQDLYVFHAVSSKLIGKAAHLISERPDIESWAELKTVLIQHFGDPRSEECIAIQLETLKINHNESYLDFCNRIQQVKSSLIAKVNLINDDHIRRSKITIYDNMARNAFLYNLPEDLIRIVRLKGSNTLEQALSIVLEEVNFQFQYNSRNKMLRPGLTDKSQPSAPHNPYVEKFGLKPFFTANANPPNQGGFKFGIQNQFRPNQPQGLNNGAHPAPQYKFGVPNAPPGFRPQFGQPQQNFRFGIPNQGQQFGTPQGYRPNFGQAPMQPRPNFNQPQPNQFKFGIPGPQKPVIPDATMRTVLPASRPNQAFNNEIEVYTDGENNYYDYNDVNYENRFYNNDQVQVNAMDMADCYYETEELTYDENFYKPASDTTPPK